MQTDYKKLTEHYLSSYGEQNRFQLDQMHHIEYITTMRYLLKYLPKGCTVLDCCAGGGAYAFSLAKEGYKVIAGDLIKEHTDILNEKNKNGLLEMVYQGNVLNMSLFANESFDAVLCMGALYHLLELKEREKCVAECLRILKNGGIFAFAYLNRNAARFNNLFDSKYSVHELSEKIKTGISGAFYFMDFDEATKLVSKYTVEKITEIGVDGLAYSHILKPRLNQATPEEFAYYMEYHLETCEQPLIIGHSMHVLWIGRKTR